MATLNTKPDRAELTSLVADHARSLSRVPLLLGGFDALLSVLLLSLGTYFG